MESALDDTEDQSLMMTTALVQNISDPAATVLTAFDGRELSLMSLGTQTEWSWMADMQARAASENQSVCSEDGNDEGGNMTKDSDRARSSNSKKKTSRSSRSSLRSGRSSRASGARTRASGVTIPAYPEPRIDDEYGILLVDDQDSDASDTNVRSDFIAGSVPTEMAAKSDENFIDAHVADEQDGIMPSVGPPQILQYLRESEIPIEEAFPNRSAEDLQAVSMQEGETCDFCGRAIQSLPSQEDQISKSPQLLYCCAEFRKLLEFALKYQSQQMHKLQEENSLIDVAPHASFGRRKKSAQELQRIREEAEKRRKQQQQERQRRAAEAAEANAQAKKREQAAVELDVGRQMRTINYSLSSMRCMEEGWTLRPPSPLGDAGGDLQMFDFELDEAGDLPVALGVSHRDSSEAVMEKFYPNGKKFVTLFADRTGNVFYPSGNVAIVITKQSDKAAHLAFVVMDDQALGRTRVLAVFDSVGKGTCYSRDGAIRITYDPVQGLDIDQRGHKRRQWRWTGLAGQHVHAPPFQPIAMSVNKTIGLRLVSRDAIFLSFITNSRSCKINVGARFKLPDPSTHSPSTHLSPLDLYLAEASTKIASILEKVSFLSSHPNHPKPEKVPNSLHLESKRQRNQAARARLGLGRVS